MTFSPAATARSNLADDGGKPGAGDLEQDAAAGAIEGRRALLFDLEVSGGSVEQGRQGLADELGFDVHGGHEPQLGSVEDCGGHLSADGAEPHHRDR